jgi:hypothetical protein
MMLAWTACLAIFAFVAGCGSDSPVTPGATLTAIGVSAASASIAKGTTTQLTATGTYSDKTTKDLTAKVAWSTSDVTVATISDDAATKGLATGVAKGTATLTASLADSGSTLSGTTTLTITDVALKSLAVSPATLTLARGTTSALKATGTFQDDTTQDLTESVDWSSSVALTASVSIAPGSRGVVTAVDAGATTITAKFGTIAGKSAVTVTSATLAAIQVTSAHPWVAKGMTEQFSALGIFTDGTTQDLTTQAAWATTTEHVTISNEKGKTGLATAVSEGDSSVVATLLGVVGTRQFDVTSATVTSLAVTPTDPTIATGTVKAFQATAILSDGTFQDVTAFATWKSSAAAVATVADDAGSKGRATGVSAGTATITATYAALDGSTDLNVTGATLTRVDLTPLNSTLATGVTQQFAAIGTFSDKSAQDVTDIAVWTSSTPGVATISTLFSSRGLATGVSQGASTITATVDGKSDSTVLTVTAAILTSITITPPYPTIAKGSSIQLTATGTYSDDSTKDLTYLASWTTSEPAAVVYSLSWLAGSVYGVNPGESIVTAAFGGKSGKTLVTVSAATLSTVTITPTNAAIAKGTSLQLTATGTYSDSSTQDLTSFVTWSTADASVKVSNAGLSHGLATGVVQGSSLITATLGAESGSTTLTVTAATLVSLAVTPQDPTIAKGTATQLTATGTYTDNSMQDLTGAVSWSSSAPGVAVSNAAPLPGLAAGVAVGPATITANLGGKSASTTVTVTAATLTTLALLPSGSTIAKGTVQWFKVTGLYTDNTIQDLTGTTSFASSDPTKVIISNAAASHGLATGVAPGTVTISASYGGKTATTTLTVTTATLVSIAVTPATASIALGATQQYKATGTFSDSSTQNLTTLVTWQSSSQAAAIISNAAASKGLATAVTAGTTTISALFSGKSGATTLIVGG